MNVHVSPLLPTVTELTMFQMTAFLRAAVRTFFPFLLHGPGRWMHFVTRPSLFRETAGDTSQHVVVEPGAQVLCQEGVRIVSDDYHRSHRNMQKRLGVSTT